MSQTRSVVLIPSAMAIAAMSSSQVEASSAARSMTQRVLHDTYRRYDFHFSKLDDVECLSDLDEQLCPQDNKIPCGGLEGIERFCRNMLGSESFEEYPDAASTERDGTNPLAGCINYVSWEDEHLNCCPSDHCFDLTGEWSDWEYVVPGEEDEEDGFEYEYQPFDEEELEELEAMFNLSPEDLAALEEMLSGPRDEIDEDEPTGWLDPHNDFDEEDSDADQQDNEQEEIFDIIRVDAKEESAVEVDEDPEYGANEEDEETFDILHAGDAMASTESPPDGHEMVDEKRSQDKSVKQEDNVNGNHETYDLLPRNNSRRPQAVQPAKVPQFMGNAS